MTTRSIGRIAAGLLFLLGAAAPASTQAPDSGQRTNFCLVDYPFPPTPANRVPARELAKLFAGKAGEFIRRPDPAANPQGAAPNSGGQGARRNPAAPPAGSRGLDWSERVFTVDYRADGSIFSRCEERRTNAEAFQPCRSRRATETVQGANEIGVWRIADELFCRTFSQLTSGIEVCHSVHRQDGRYLMKHVRGPSGCAEGEILFK